MSNISDSEEMNRALNAARTGGNLAVCRWLVSLDVDCGEGDDAAANANDAVVRDFSIKDAAKIEGGKE